MRVNRRQITALARSIATIVSNTNQLQLSEDSEAFAWLAIQIASPMVDYHNNLDAIRRDAEDAIQMHNIDPALRDEIVETLHSSRGVPRGLSKEATATFLAERIADALQGSTRLGGQLSSSHAELTAVAKTVLLDATWEQEQ